MKNIYKTNMRKLMKSKFYIAGLMIAVAVTFMFTGDMMGFGGIFDDMGATGRMHFIGAAIIAFFTIYTPLFVCEEYTEGSIKNKLIAGFTQKEIFGAGIMTQLSAMFIMWLVYLVAGFIGGARPSGHGIGVYVITLVAMTGYVALVYSVSFRLSKPVRSAIVSFIILNVCFNMVTFGNLLIMICEGTALKIAAVIYNISALGQWFVYTGLADDAANPGAVLQILVSLVIVILSVLFGISKLNTRDLK
jgi:hypothetical protein